MRPIPYASAVNRTALRVWKYLFLALLAAGLMVAGASAQVAGGTVTGSVADVQGGVLPMAVATITNAATGVVTKAGTNNDGLYRFSNLPAGTYELVVSCEGFANGKRSDIVVTVGSTVAVNFSLPLQSVGATVNVVGEESGVATSSAAISYDVPGPEIRELPLNGRDFTTLATLQPGVALIGSSGGLRTGLGQKMAISGGRPEKNNYLWDGISLNDNGNNSPGSVLGITLGVEAVDQFTLLTNSFSAEYGNTGGGVINAVTRSGTNNLHGEGFMFARNSAMDTEPWNYKPSSGLPPPAFHRYQFGGAVGGPIIKDRTFWFVDYEGLDQATGTPTTSIVPLNSNFNYSTLTANLQASADCPGNKAPCTVPIDPNVAVALQLYPAPNVTCTLGCTADQGEYYTVVTAAGKEKYFFGKLDHKISEKDSVRANYFYDQGTLQSPDGLNQVVTQQFSERQGIGAEYTRVITPNVVNVARAGFTRSVQTSGGIAQVLDQAIANPALAQVPGKDNGSVSIGGYASLTTGPKSTDYNYEKFNTFQEYENVYITHGRHTIKVGVDVERLDDNLFLPTASGGQYSFNTLATFLSNSPSNWTGMTLSSTMERGERQTIFGSYVQDDIKVNRNLVANVGFRYEFTTIPTEVNHNRIAILHNLLDTYPRVGGPVLDTNPSLKDFSPRVGVTWDPTGKGQTTIHAGFGEYDNLIMQNQYDMILSRSLPFFVEGVFTTSTAPGNTGLKGSFPGGAYNLISGSTTTVRTDYIDPNPPRSYTMQWNVNIQQAFLGWTGQVGYVGTRGVHLDQTERNMNSVQPVVLNGVYSYFSKSGGPGTLPTQADRLNPVFASINCTDTFNADSDYSALQVSVHRPLSKGLLVQGSYTWAKSIDDTSSTSSVQAGTGYPNAIGNPDPLIAALNRGLSDFNVESMGILSVVYDVPSPSLSSKLARATASGWELSTIFRDQTGFPFSAIINNDIAHTLTDTTGTNLGQRAVQLASCKTTNPGSFLHYLNNACFAAPAPGTLSPLRRNSLTAPGTLNADFSLIKNDHIREKITGQLRVEFFNVTNHPNYAAPAFTFFTGGQIVNGASTTPTTISSAGVISSTTGNQRQLQLAYKVQF